MAEQQAMGEGAPDPSPQDITPPSPPKSDEPKAEQPKSGIKPKAKKAQGKKAVSLPGHPEFEFKAKSDEDAIAQYMSKCGINSTIHKFHVRDI